MVKSHIFLTLFEQEGRGVNSIHGSEIPKFLKFQGIRGFGTSWLFVIMLPQKPFLQNQTILGPIRVDLLMVDSIIYRTRISQFPKISQFSVHATFFNPLPLILFFS